MSREANIEMERSRRQHEYEKKFGKDPVEKEPTAEERHARNEATLTRMRAMKEHQNPYWDKK